MKKEKNKNLEENKKEAKEEILENETKDKNLEEIEILNKKLNELDDKYKRNLAEFENYKKRTEKEKLKTYERAKVDLIEKLLPVIDSLDAAKKISEDEKYTEGLEMVYKQIETFLAKNNVEEIKTIGEFFDPELHEAISMVESDKEEGMIIEEFRKGYKLGNDIIRHSMVIVSK